MLDEKLKIVMAWLAWAAQILNGVVLVLNNLGDVLNTVSASGVADAAQLAVSGQKGSILQTVFAIGLGVVQGFLPRILVKR